MCKYSHLINSMCRIYKRTVNGSFMAASAESEHASLPMDPIFFLIRPAFFVEPPKNKKITQQGALPYLLFRASTLREKRYVFMDISHTRYFHSGL